MTTKQATKLCTGQKITADLHLIRRAQRGEEEAFARLYTLHKRRIYGLCLYISGAADVAERITRRVFIQVFGMISDFTEEHALGAALNELAIDLAISVRQNRKDGGSLCQIGKGHPQPHVKELLPDTGEG